MRRLALLVCVVLLARLSWCDEGHHHDLSEEELGSVHFVTSCAPNLEKNFNRAVALLHSFQYEEARAAFEAVSVQDPKCAMAQWGVAMSHYHGLWDNGDTAAGRVAWHKAKDIANANPRTTAREVGYIDALGEIYAEDGKDKYLHGQGYEQKMGALQDANPSDSEAAIFHALSLAIVAPKTDRTFANQRKCGEILEPIFAKQPHHPGVAHYLIHCYDNPLLAEKGLPAARLYAKIAPVSAHANHMPSHIFTRVGSWEESIDSNRKSADLAAEAEKLSRDGEARDQRLHSMDYLEYAYLQSGRVQLAKSVRDEMNGLAPAQGLTQTGNYALAAIPARFVFERSQWEEASALTVHENGSPFAQAITWMTIGVGSARSNHLDKAAKAEQTLAELRDSIARSDAYWSKQVEVQRLEVAAWIAEANGKKTDALDKLRAAADLEESMDKSPATPGAVTPAREMLAQLQLQEKDPQSALASFQDVLKLAPNRFNALYGAASAAEAAGDASTAHRYYQMLTRSAVGDERPELVAAREKVVALAQEKITGKK